MTSDALLVTSSAAVVLAEAATLATGCGATEVDVPHLLGALACSVSDGRPSRLRAVLVTLDVDLSTLVDSAPRGDVFTDLVGLSAGVCALVGTAAELAAAAGEAAAATPHLLAAAVELGHAAALVDRGVTADLLLARAADSAVSHDTASDDPDDIVWAPRPKPLAATSALPVTPSPEELSRRTTGRRSAAVARLMSGILPSGRRVSSPLVRRWVRRWAGALVVEFVSGVAVALALTVHAVEHGTYWLLALVLPLVIPAAIGSVPVLLARLSLIIIESPLIGGLVVVNAAGALVAVWTMAWMLRVDRGDPGLSRSAVWRGYWRKSREMINERMANAVRAES